MVFSKQWDFGDFTLSSTKYLEGSLGRDKSFSFSGRILKYHCHSRIVDKRGFIFYSLKCGVSYIYVCLSKMSMSNAGSRDENGHPGTEADAGRLKFIKRGRTASVRLKDGFGRRTIIFPRALVK